MSFLKRFQASLESLYLVPENNSYVVAYSGGIDSHVLLYCCSLLNLPVRAIHVHHGLQAIADDWVEHCQTVCKQLHIHLDVVYVDGRQKKGESPEQSARNARYQALKKHLTSGDCLLTAQHLNDQAETFLLQLLRTASAAGLAAMPALRQIGGAMHARPLLFFARSEVEQFAEQNALHWIEDPTNLDVSLDRNFVRKNIIPILQNRWPELLTQLSTAASLQSNNLSVQEDMAAIDLARAIVSQTNVLKNNAYSIVAQLSIDTIQSLSVARLLNLLRYWIIRCANKQPTRNLLEEITKTLINSQQDVRSVIIFAEYEFRKYRSQLYLLKKNVDVDVDITFEWKPSTSPVLSLPHCKLVTIDAAGKGLQRKLRDQTLTIRFRKGGERFHPSNRQHSQSLKKFLQEAGIPPWERDAIPLLYAGEELVAVTGLAIAKNFTAGEHDDGWFISCSAL